MLTDARTGAVVEDVTVDGMPRANAREVALALAPVGDTRRASGRASRLRSRCSSCWVRARTTRTACCALARRGARASARRSARAANGPFTSTCAPTARTRSIGGHDRRRQERAAADAGRLARDLPPADRLTFLLVDYKGGAAFKECVGLPHTVGFVTDLDSHLTQRALTSLNAELKRREHMLRDAGREGPDRHGARSRAAPPCLVIVIDEFATLAKEVPEFVEGVVDVAQRGRSLGVHLVLATQRPGGVVSDNIRANINLRIALRMAAPAESADIVGVTDAARIARAARPRVRPRRPGRADRVPVGLRRRHHDDRRRRPADRAARAVPARRDRRRAAPRPPKPRPVGPSRAVVAQPAEAARRRGIALAGLAVADPLPAVLAPEDTGPAFGVIDEPPLQRSARSTTTSRPTAAADLRRAGSGKTALLRTIAVALAAQPPPDGCTSTGSTSPRAG